MKAEAGHEVYALTPEQLDAWKKAAEPLKRVGRGVKKAGGDPDAAYEELQGSAREVQRGLLRTALDMSPRRAAAIASPQRRAMRSRRGAAT